MVPLRASRHQQFGHSVASECPEACVCLSCRLEGRAMSDAERPPTPSTGASSVTPKPPYAREDADVDERSERNPDVLSEGETAELEARKREHGRPYEAKTSR